MDTLLDLIAALFSLDSVTVNKAKMADKA